MSFREHSNGNINGPGPDTAFYHVITQQSMDPGYATQLALGMTTTKAAYKRYDGADGDSDWNIFITDKNYQDYIKAITYNGGDRTIIPANSDLNDYTTYGIYKCGTDGATITLNNCPTDYAFLLDVIPSTGQDRAFDEAPEGASVWMSYATQILYTWTNEFFSRVITISVNGSNTSYGWGVWRRILNSTNYNEYAPTLTGTGASGTWNINVTGTASTATYAHGANEASYANRINLPRQYSQGDYDEDLPGAERISWREFSSGAVNGPGKYYYHVFTGHSADTNFYTQLALGMTTDHIAYRRVDFGNSSGWHSVITDKNYGSYTEKSHPLRAFSSSEYSTYADAILAKKAEGYTSGILCAVGWHPTDMPASGNWSTVWWRCSCGNAIFSIQLYIDRDISLWFGTLAGGENNNQITWSRVYTNKNKPSASDIGAASSSHTHIQGDGVMEVGQHLDFHIVGSSTADHDQRLSCNSSGFYFTGTMQGLFKSHAGTDYTTSRLRNIRFGTSVPSSLSNGEVFFVYE